jgi:hypothetical protein
MRLKPGHGLPMNGKRVEGSEMKSRHRTAMLIATMLAAVIGFAAVASAGTFNTTLRLNRYSLGFFYGVVKSPQPKCKVRRVGLYVMTGEPPKLTPIGGTKSGRNGHWKEVDGHGLGGDYYAKVPEKTIRINGRRHTCKADISNRFTR